MRTIVAGYEHNVPLDTLVDHDDNPNQGDDGTVHDLIETNGWYGVIVADQHTRRILAGHTRKRVLQAAGETVAPEVQWVQTVDDDHARRILVGDNRATRLGYDTPDILTPLLTHLQHTPTGLTGTGYDTDDLDTLINDQQAALTLITPHAGAPTGHGPQEVTCPACAHTFIPERP